jgi:hypothetical protein
MRRTILAALSLLGLLICGEVRALEATGTFKTVDAEKGIMVVFANGQDRTLRIAEDVKVTGTDGKPLEGGIKARELTSGTVVTISVEFSDGGPVLKELRLGRANLSGGATGGGATGGGATGTLKTVDAEKGIMVVFANGQDRTLRIAEDVKVTGTDGKPLEGGIKAKELTDGTLVTVRAEFGGGMPVLKELRLGRANLSGPALEGKPTVGIKPLTDMTAQDMYKGEDGGLYGGGRNEPPPALLAMARAETVKIVPLDAQGKPADDGVIAVVSLSMSNATQEYSRFKEIADADPRKSPRVKIVDCAQGGQAMAQWGDPRGRAWTEADRRLAIAKVSPEQVQVVWVKLANVKPTGTLSEHGKKLEKDTTILLQNARDRFPNLRIAYLSGRIYGGWATTPLNPEPYAHESNVVVRWMIRDQNGGDPELNCDPAKGTVKVPLVLWGPYLWADGTTPRRTDGLVWEREDLSPNDGTHPSQSGRKKVADMLLKFFTEDPLAQTWFVKN